MMEKPIFGRNYINLTRISLIIILLTGTFLRFYHLGEISFWLDEAGVAYAARAASLVEMLQVVRSHVLAMPLDYLVVWLVGRISTQEAVLRIPAAIWGSASLFVAFRFFRHFLQPIPALFGLLILSLAPLHIQYSQELRFYSSLVFFYLLSTLLLWNAIQDSSLKNWALFTAVCILGIFFHPYVLFVFATGILWMGLRILNGDQTRNQKISILLSATICLIAFLSGYLIFSASNTFQIPLMAFEQSPPLAIATGLGWMPFFPGTLNLSWVWGFLCAAIEGVGAVAIVINQPKSPLAGLAYSTLLQICAVFGADLLGHYFFAPRQLLMLLPLLCIFAGLGSQKIISYLSRISSLFFTRTNPQTINKAVTFCLIALITLASLPALQVNWQDDKGDTRGLSETILKKWKPGSAVLITPGFEGFVYKYYMDYVYKREDISQKLWGVSWEEVADTGSWAGQLFLITPSNLSTQNAEQLQSLGYSPDFHSYPQSRYAKTLWVRP